MITMSGDVLYAGTRTVTPPQGATWEPFEATDVRIFNGETIEYLRVPDALVNDLPAKGDRIEAVVRVSAYLSKKHGDARLQFTLVSYSVLAPAAASVPA